VTIADFVQDLKEKLGLAQPTPRFGPPPVAYVAPRPLPIAQPTNAPRVPEQPQASLVSSVAHSKGRKQDEGSLVGGR